MAAIHFDLLDRLPKTIEEKFELFSVSIGTKKWNRKVL